MKKIYKEPFYVIFLFLRSCIRALKSYEALFFIICFSIMYYILPDYTYFLFLGILSSIGIGTGIHTGTLIVFPKFVNIATDGEDFKTACLTAFPYAVIWGTGTALGELPPFLMANRLIKEYNNENFSRIINWTRHFIDIFGAFGIFVLSCYPNVAFDMAGIIAGISDMKTSRFLFATILGKGFVKAPTQAFIIIYTAQKMTVESVTSTNQNFYYLNLLYSFITKILMVVTTCFTIESIANTEYKYYILKKD
jgi:membrane protein DedA with SNARE-associated domain